MLAGLRRVSADAFGALGELRPDDPPDLVMERPEEGEDDLGVKVRPVASWRLGRDDDVRGTSTGREPLPR